MDGSAVVRPVHDRVAHVAVLLYEGQHSRRTEGISEEFVGRRQGRRPPQRHHESPVADGSRSRLTTAQPGRAESMTELRQCEMIWSSSGVQLLAIRLESMAALAVVPRAAIDYPL